MAIKFKSISRFSAREFFYSSNSGDIYMISDYVAPSFQELKNNELNFYSLRVENFRFVETLDETYINMENDEKSIKHDSSVLFSMKDNDSLRELSFNGIDRVSIDKIELVIEQVKDIHEQDSRYPLGYIEFSGVEDEYTKKIEYFFTLYAYCELHPFNRIVSMLPIVGNDQSNLTFSFEVPDFDYTKETRILPIFKYNFIISSSESY